jgi:hypothetical protein
MQAKKPGSLDPEESGAGEVHAADYSLADEGKVVPKGGGDDVLDAITLAINRLSYFFGSAPSPSPFPRSDKRGPDINPALLSHR